MIQFWAVTAMIKYTAEKEMMTCSATADITPSISQAVTATTE